MQQRLTFHADPAHGWLEVTRADLAALNIESKISRYSYASGNKVFLEEDADASHYLEAAKAKGWIINIQENFTNGDSPIRNLPHFERA